jgi:6-pyruvoyl-tetrahydropterin synthase-like protein
VARLHPRVILVAAAILLMAPSLVMGTLLGHDAPHTLKWAFQFEEQFRAGVLYPRWLPGSFDGIGGPVFYFYPPFSYWIDALVNVATANLLPVSYTLSVSRLVMMLASGLAMHAWLEAANSPPRAALIGAIVYMAAPYHLFDHYVRAAQAEFSVYTLIPLVMLGVRHTATRLSGVVLLAVGYGLLAMAHLPSLLLVSYTALPLYVLYTAWRIGDRRCALGFLARCALGGALGVGLAAIYLVPVLALERWINTAELWFGFEHFLLLPLLLAGKLEPWLHVVAWSTLAYTLAAIAVLASAGRAGSEAAFWAVVSLLCAAFISGAVPWFWQLPETAKVQFPFRLLIVLEFAVVSALCLTPWPIGSRPGVVILAAAAVALVPTLYALGRDTHEILERPLPRVDKPRYDAFEYLPAGFDRRPEDDAILKSVVQPTVACTPAPSLCRADETGLGGLRIEVDSDQPTTVVLRRFYFPGWRLEPALAIGATDRQKLLTFTAPPGRHVWQLTRQPLPAERWGLAISSLSLIVLLGVAAIGRRRAAGGDASLSRP